MDLKKLRCFSPLGTKVGITTLLVVVSRHRVMRKGPHRVRSYNTGSVGTVTGSVPSSCCIQSVPHGNTVATPNQ